MVNRAGGRCEVSGIEFQRRAPGVSRNPWTPSIDRIDSSVGYTAANCRLVCLAVNLAMSTWGEDVILTIADCIRRKRSELSVA
jgi:hypothetical protein